MTSQPAAMPKRTFLAWCLWVGMYSLRPPPTVERYLALICGLIIIGVTCRVWFALQCLTTDLGFWSGPSDPYLLQFRPGTAWMWQHDPFGIALMAWAILGLAALGPFTSAAWRGRSWLTVTWGVTTLIGCSAYVLIGFNLLLMPLGLFG